MLTENLPPGIAFALPQLGLIFVGALIERHYVSRVNAFTNSLALATHIASRPDVGFWLGVYADLGLLMGLIGILAYLTERSLRTEYYVISLLLYSGLPIGVVILLSGQWVIGLVSAGVLTLLVAYFLPSGVTLVYTDWLDGTVYEFAKGTTIEHTNHEIGYRTNIDLLDAIRND
jgi:hypothetical protein